MSPRTHRARITFGNVSKDASRPHYNNRAKGRKARRKEEWEHRRLFVPYPKERTSPAYYLGPIVSEIAAMTAYHGYLSSQICCGCGVIFYRSKDKNGVLKQFEEELKAYLEGDLKKFTVPIKTYGSDFQKEVWSKLLELPYGSTQSYGDLAKAMGRAGSHARAIGAACGANSHLLVVPCHRLVASMSKGGFNSGVNRKEWLLQLEKKHS